MHHSRKRHASRKQFGSTKAQNTLARLFETNMFGMLYGDFEGRILDANHALLNMVGYSLEEFKTGQVGWKVLTPPEYWAMDEEAIRQLRQYGIFKPYEKQFIRKDGQRIDILIGAIAEKVSAESAVAFVLDITAQKHAERALQEGEKRFRTLAESSPMMVWLQGPEHELLYANQQILNYNGITFEELMRTGWEKYIHPEDLPRSLELLKRDFSTRSYHENEARLLRGDGTYRWMLMTGAPVITPEGEFMGYVGTALDITERKMAERQLADYAQKLEQSNKELEHFATIASHDLQEPVRKILLFSDHLQKTEKSSMSEEAIEDMERIQRAAGKMQRLITDLLDLSRVTRRGAPYQKIELNELINEVIADLSYSHQDIRSRVELNGSLTIDADPKQVHQMMSQLLDNALKFHKPDLLSSVKIEIEREGEQCRISVHDNGIGIKAEHIGKIFDTFVRLHHGAEYSGTGIGLPLAQKIAERHHGTISVNSIPGEGSTFTVLLPLLQERTRNEIPHEEHRVAEN